jgi:hypothetical protein
VRLPYDGVNPAHPLGHFLAVRAQEEGFIFSRRSFLTRISAAVALAMRPARLLSAEALARLAGSQASESGPATPAWTPRQSPLMTQWSAHVDPKAPLPEYPRPQFVRKDWLNLNGIWEFQQGNAGDAPPFGRPLTASILVPYPVESALSGVMQHYDRLWYRRSISIPRAWQGKRMLLHFGAVDWESEVFINGQSLGVHRGGYDPFSYDIADLVKPGEDAELVVRGFDPTEEGGQPRGKQNTHPHGITYTPTTGIWQTVWLEPVAPVYMADFLLIPDIDRAELSATITANTDNGNAEVHLQVRDGDTVVATATAKPGAEVRIAIPRQKLWSPGQPFLYDLELTLVQSSQVVDTVRSYFGMRKSHIGDVGGQKKLLFNNQFVFQLGPLDQGFWPDGIYTAPTDDALRSDIESMKQMGFNMVRKHIKVEPARWYYWADKLGLLVWQDMPSCNSYPGRQFVPPPIDKQAYELELRRMVETHRNVPSIIQWETFNEGQGQFDTEKMVNLVRSLDPSRTIDEASGGVIFGFGDINDVHSYPEPAVRPCNGRQAMVCGEFGGIGYLIADHSWQREGKSYVEVSTAPDLRYLYAEFMQQVQPLVDIENLSAAVYTELTDVMTEINGLLTYDRVPKLPLEQIQQINSFQFPSVAYKDIVPTSAEQPQLWKYTMDKPDGDAWRGLGFDDGQWKQGPGEFGNHGNHIGTPWSGPNLWLRKHFNLGTLTSQQVDALVLTIYRQTGMEIYINGVETNVQHGNDRAFESTFEHRPMNTAARNAIIMNGDNVIAVHCRGARNQQMFDLGLSIRES